MDKKYDRSIQGEQKGMPGGKQGPQRTDSNVEKRGNVEKGPDAYKRQSEPAQQGGERKQGQGGYDQDRENVGGGQQRKDQGR